MELGYPLPKRQDFITKISKKPSKATQPVNFQGTRHDLPRCTVPIGFAKYRLENGRTADQQAEYIAKNPEVGEDFFRRDAESELAQKQQHVILTNLAAEKNLPRYFDKHKQEQPLILSENGFVVNGNRRLCTWRELYEKDSKKYSHFAHVEVVFLPPCDPQDLDEIEAELQVQEDIKAEYRWTARACMLREKKEELGYSDNELMRIYGLKKSQLNDLLGILDSAEIYLEQRGWPKQYTRVAKSEFAFRQLRSQRKKAKVRSEAEKEVLETAAFALIDNPDDGRAYGVIKDLGDKFEDVIDDLMAELDVDEVPEDAEATFNNLAQAIDQVDNREKVREVVINTIERERIFDRAKKKREYALTQIGNASKALAIALQAADKKAERGNAKQLLEEIQVSVEQLTSWADGKD